MARSAFVGRKVKKVAMVEKIENTQQRAGTTVSTYIGTLRLVSNTS